METIHVRNDETISRITGATFPGYNGKTFKLTVHDTGGMNLVSYWSGGSRDYYSVIRLEDMKAMPVPQNGSGFDAFGHGIDAPLPAPGFAVVAHSIFQGKDHGITIHLHRENAAKLLPAPVELTRHERIVLVATRSLKSSYMGRTRAQMAREETRITQGEWDAAKANLIARKFLNAAGAITVEGRNAAGTGSLYNLRETKEVISN